MKKKRKLYIAVAFIVVLIISGVIIIATIFNNKITLPINPVRGDNRYQIDSNSMLYEGSIKSIQGKRMELDSGGRQLDIDISSRVPILNVANSNRENVIQLGNTLVVRFSVDDKDINKATSVTKIEDFDNDNNLILLNGSVVEGQFDVIGKVVEKNDDNFTIDTDVKSQRIKFEINNPIFQEATSFDISNIAPQAYVKVWAREIGPGFRAIFIVIPN
jgi:hypothetical protein